MASAGKSTPGRGGANSINALIDAWSLTKRPNYLVKAEELIRRCIHPDDDIAALNLLNTEKQWSYTMFLTALARYLDTKAECQSFDEMYAYAQQSLLHYARWMAEFERPYLDNPDEFAKLQADPSLVPSAVEEIVRWVTPVNYMKRTVARDTHVGDQKVDAGDELILFYASGNRDEEVFDALAAAAKDF